MSTARSTASSGGSMPRRGPTLRPVIFSIDAQGNATPSTLPAASARLSAPPPPAPTAPLSEPPPAPSLPVSMASSAISHADELRPSGGYVLALVHALQIKSANAVDAPTASVQLQLDLGEVYLARAPHVQTLQGNLFATTTAPQAQAHDWRRGEAS